MLCRPSRKPRRPEPTRPARAIAPSTSSKSSRVRSPFGIQFGVQLAGGTRSAGPQARDHRVGSVQLRLAGRAEVLADAVAGRAEIADAAALLAVGEVAEVAHQGGHAALVAFGVADHQVHLLLLLLGLRDVGIAPVVVAARDVLGEIDHGAAVNPQLLERLVEDVRHPCRTLVLERRLLAAARAAAVGRWRPARVTSG